MTIYGDDDDKMSMMLMVMQKFVTHNGVGSQIFVLL